VLLRWREPQSARVDGRSVAKTNDRHPAVIPSVGWRGNTSFHAHPARGRREFPPVRLILASHHSLACRRTRPRSVGERLAYLEGERLTQILT